MTRLKAVPLPIEFELACLYLEAEVLRFRVDSSLTEELELCAFLLSSTQPEAMSSITHDLGFEIRGEPVRKLQHSLEVWAVREFDFSLFRLRADLWTYIDYDLVNRTITIQDFHRVPELQAVEAFDFDAKRRMTEPRGPDVVSEREIVTNTEI